MKKLLFFLFLTLLLTLPVNAETLSSYFQGHLPSILERRNLANQCQIKNYVGSLRQNLSLLKCLKNQDQLLASKLSKVIPTKTDLLGAGYNPVTGYQSRTTQYISASATTIPVVSTKDTAGNQIDLANISPSSTVKVYMNLAPGTSKEEPVVCTGVTVSSWTSCTRGLVFQGSSETSSTTISVAHNAGTPIIITNVSQFYSQYVSIDGAQQINGVKTFTSSPIVPNPASSETTAAASVQYVNNIAVQGAATSTDNNLGLVQLGTAAQLASSTASSSAGAPLIVPAKFVSTSLYTAQKGIVPATENDGKLNQTFLDLTDSFSFSASSSFTSTTNFTASSSLFKYDDDRGSANQYAVTLSPVPSAYTVGMMVYFRASATSTASSTLNVNSLGVKQIYKFNKPIGLGDIRTGQDVAVMYDGTVFQILSPTRYFSESMIPLPTSGTVSTTVTALGDNTRASMGLLEFPHDMIVSKFSYDVISVGSAGAFNVGLYTSDGQNRLFTTTTASISSSGFKTTYVTSTLMIPAGQYYMVWVPIGTANVSFTEWYNTVGDLQTFVVGTTGEPDWEGYTTVSAGILPVTFDPTSLSASDGATIKVRFDN